MKQLPPLLLKSKYWEHIEAEILRALVEIIYSPLLSVLKEPDPEYHNSQSAITDAVRAGSVWYEDGKFIGTFNAKISSDLRSMGAVYRKKTWVLERQLVPAALKMVQVHATSKYNATRRGLIRTLNDVDIESVTKLLKSKDAYKKTITWMDGDFEKSLKSITIAPKLTPEQRDIIAEQWGQNLDLYVKGWTENNIISLREKIQANTFAGARAESLHDLIRSNYGVSQRKAKFLARQETSLLMSKFRETRYKSAGVTRYRWSSSSDERVRKSHKHLDGNIFDFSDPPISDLKTGARNNPGEDWGCFAGNSKIYVLNRIEKCFRRWYCGELTEIITELGKTIRATPNHPVLTINGWKPIGSLNDGDHIIYIPQKLLDSSERNNDKCESFIRDIFESSRKSFSRLTRRGSSDQFHGDGSARKIDIIDTASFLCLKNDTSLSQGFVKLFFTLSEFFAFCVSRLFEHLCSFGWWYSFCSFVCGFSKITSFFKRKFAHSYPIGLRPISNRYTVFDKPSPDDNSLKTCSFRDGKFTLARDVSLNYGFHIELQSVMGVSFDRVVFSRNAYFIGHVYNIQTDLGYYTTAGVIVSNCRCVAIALVE